MWNKGDNIIGRYNYPIDGTYYACTLIKHENEIEYIKLMDIKDYKVKLFEDNKNTDIYDMIEVMESLNDDQTFKFNERDFIKMVGNYDLILLNQKLINTLFINDASVYSMKYLEGLQLKNKLIPIYLLPKDNICIYLLKLDSEQKIISYKKLKRGD